MRKLLTLFTALLFVGSMWGENATYRMTPDQATSGSDATTYITSLTEFTHDGITWQMNQWNPKTLQIKTNQSSAASEFRFYNSSAFSGRIVQVVITFSALAVSDASKLMFIGGTKAQTGTTGGTAGTWNSTEKTLTWTPGESDNYTYFAFYQNGKAASGTNYLASSNAITVTYEEPDPSIEVNPTSVAFGNVKQYTEDGEGSRWVAEEIQLTGANLTSNVSLSIANTAVFNIKDPTKGSGVTSLLTIAPHEGEIDTTITVVAYTNADGEASQNIAVSSANSDFNTFNIPLSINITPTFEVSVVANNNEYGTVSISGGVSGDDSYQYADDNDELTIVATPKPGYEFVNWTYDGDIVMLDSDDDVASNTAIASEEATITANFKVSTTPIIEISETALDWGSVAVGTVLAGKTFTITGLNLTANVALAWDGEGDDAFTYEVTTGNLTPTDGAVSATITVTPKVSAVGSYVNELTVSSTGATSQAVDAALTILQTYTAKWYVNGEELTESTQNAVAGTDLEFPSDPAKLSDDCAEMVFKGWAEAAIVGKQDDAPTYTTKTKMPEADVNFYAVFASEEQSGSIDKKSVSTTMSDYVTANGCTVSAGQDVTMYTSLTLDENITLSTTGEANCGSFWNTSSTDDTKQWRLYQNKSGNATVTALNGYELKNVTITYVVSNTGTLTGLTSGEKTEVSGTSVTYNVGNTASATNGQVRITAIEVEYEKNDLIIVTKDYLTTCPSCPKVTLEATEAANGTVELSSYLVQTCEAAEVTVTTTPATGYELSNIAISELSGASISGNTISLAAETAGELTVTATFTKINYTVTLEQDVDAGATLTGATDEAHYGGTINITAEDKAGFIFDGWTASPAVTFADASALETSFTMPNSNVTITANYSKIYTTEEALTLESGIDVYIAGIVVSAYGTYSNSYYISDNGSTTNQFICFKGNDVTMTVGNKVLVHGTMGAYKGTPQLAEGYTLVSSSALSSVTISGTATKTEYAKNASFDFAGLIATATWGDDTSLDVTENADWSADPETITAAGNVTVTATWNGKSGSKDVAVTVTPTAIDNTEVEGKAVKVLRNGILLIEKNGRTYNAMGQIIK